MSALKIAEVGLGPTSFQNITTSKHQDSLWRKLYGDRASTGVSAISAARVVLYVPSAGLSPLCRLPHDGAVALRAREPAQPGSVPLAAKRHRRRPNYTGKSRSQRPRGNEADRAGQTAAFYGNREDDFYINSFMWGCHRPTWLVIDRDDRRRNHGCSGFITHQKLSGSKFFFSLPMHRNSPVL